MQLDVISIIVSGTAIILSSYFAFIANRTNKKVNQKDFEISEELKYDLMKAIAVLRSYDLKAGLLAYYSEVSFDIEANALAVFLASPSYLLLIDAVSKEEREQVELCFHELASSKGNLPAFKTREFCRHILEVVAKSVDFKNALDINVITVLHQFCELPSFVDSQYERIAQAQKTGELSLDNFAKFLIRCGVQDPNIDIIMCRINNDEKGALAAVQKGGSYHDAGGNLLRRYNQLYKLFIIHKSNVAPLSFEVNKKLEEILEHYIKMELDSKN